MYDYSAGNGFVAFRGISIGIRGVITYTHYAPTYGSDNSDQIKLYRDVARP